MSNFQLQEQNFTKIRSIVPIIPTLPHRWLVGLTIDRCIDTVFSLYTQLYIIHTHTSQLTALACSYSPVPPASILSLLALSQGPQKLKCFQFIRPFLTYTHLATNGFFPSHSCYHHIPDLSFSQTCRIQAKTWMSIQNMYCRPLQTEWKSCAVHMSRLKCQSDD